LDVANNAFAAALYSAVERGDVAGLSMAFRAIRQEWSDDYTYRRVIETSLHEGDVSAVNMPASRLTLGTAQMVETPSWGAPVGGFADPPGLSPTSDGRARPAAVFFGEVDRARVALARVRGRDHDDTPKTKRRRGKGRVAELRARAYRVGL